MRILLCTLALLISTSTFAQWMEMTPDTEFYQERIYFYSPSHGVVIGLGGTYQQTYDGGITWDTSYIINADYSIDTNAAANRDLRCIDFPSDSIGYMGGEDGSQYRTIDGGQTWIYSSRIGQFDHVFDIKFFNNDTGVAETGNYAMWRTLDGGITWSWSLFPLAQPYRFAKLNDSTMLFCGLGIFRTTDYGASWQRMNCDSAITLVDISMSDSMNGVAAGYQGRLVRTNDGGLNWSTPATVINADINAVEMLNDSFGFIGCGIYYTANTTPDALGFVMYTFDGGLTWSQPDTICSRSIKDIEFPSDSLGFACTYSGHLLRTEHPTVATNYTTISEPFRHELKLYPNPTSSVLYIVLPGYSSVTTAEFYITDLTGRQVKENEKLVLTPYQLDVSSLTTGVYFLHCTVNGIESISKFIVQ